jgi:phage/plasmid-like protein (TIGR03299 family)
MAHNITDRDNIFTVRQPAWHGLGVVLDEYPTRKEAQTLVHNWEPVTQPLYRREIGIDAEGNTFERFEEVETHQSVVRSDDGHHLGVVTSSYNPVSNNELYDIAEAIQGEGSEVRFETGGSLLGGAKVWLLLRLNEPLQVVGDPNGETIAYYALQNSHDGNGSLRGQATMTRIVCDNTAQMADMDAQQRGTEFTFRHTLNVQQRIDEAKMALAGWREGIANWTLQMEHLLSIKLDNKQRDWFLRTFIPAPPAGHASERVMNNVENARADFLSILGGPTLSEKVAGSAYGLVQASIEWSQHYRNTRAATIEGRMENRFRRAYLDRSEYTASAVEVALEAANVD